jgi:signal transduction histidine kinase
MSEREVLLIGYLIAVIFLLVVFVLVFFFTFQKRKNRFLQERLEIRLKFDREIEKSKLEIQEQTLKNIAWELHDNVGQLLSVVNIQLNMLSLDVPSENQEQILETKGVVNDAVQEIRTLSKILNNDVILKNGLISSLSLELERFNKLKYLEARLKIIGDSKPIQNSDEIIIFRILQEFFSNVIKHAKAKKLVVLLNYKNDILEIQANDDGVGFDSSRHNGNSGLVTMKSRASLINADFEIISGINKGTSLHLRYSY